MVARVLCLIFLFGPLAIATAQNSCSPPALGHPCSPGGVAVQGPLEPGLSLGVGNPIHLATGNKHQQELDLPASPSAPLLQVLRHYNSLDPYHGVFGRGWRSSYDTRLYRVAGRLQIVQADGSRIDFGNADKPGEMRNGHGHLFANAAQWIWTWPNGHSLRFDQQGRLTRIASPSSLSALSSSKPSTQHAFAVVDIIREAQPGPLYGTITQIAASEGQETLATLRFHYRIHAGRPYISAIDTPLGQMVYRYEHAGPSSALRLTAVRRPDGYERRYRYEAEQTKQPHLVTGIALAAPSGVVLPVHSWGYDVYGRAISSERHYPESKAYALRIDYARPASERHNGLTLVDAADGRRTRFEFNVQAGKHALLRVDGATCPGCAAPGSVAQYDAKGRLQTLNSTQFVHHASGGLQRLSPDAIGWPGVRLDYNRQGLRTAWHSTATGTESTAFDDQDRPVRRRFANDDEWLYNYDGRGRPIRITARNKAAAVNVSLDWNEARLTAIRHPHEREDRRHDSQGRLIEKRVQRSLPTVPTRQHAYIDRFEYNIQHRITAHHLPEGGALLYNWDPNNQLIRIIWRDVHNRLHKVIQASPEQAGYQYGNGMRLAIHLERGGARALALYDKDSIVWDHFRAEDALNRPIREANHFVPMGLRQGWHYGYDAASRLALATVTPPSNAESSAHAALKTSWHAWHPNGQAAAVKHDEHTVWPSIQRDTSGLPLNVDGFELRYGPQRRLSQVLRHGKVLERYQHNAFGHRIGATTAHEQVQYFYLDNRLVAEARQLRTGSGRAERRPVTRRYIYAGHAVVGMIDYSATTPSGSLYAVHADLMGAPHVITDGERQIRWLAQYSPFGSAQRIAGDLDFYLRLPGQIADTTTGWHDNLLRTYDPHFGHYLEPDPLGPLPGTQAMGYAAQQPRRYIDPLGLLLFAFDGSRQNTHTGSNVWLLSQRYQDGPVFYHSGPGNPYYLDLDALAAHAAPQIIDTQWQHLLNALNGTRPNADQPVPIDIIGYSRGAALARHFGNQIEQYVDRGLFSYADPLRGQISACVDLRFMGLFDTVAQFGLGGQLNELYDLSISATWGWVAHAVALHERRWLFPLTAAAQGMVDNVIEAPFVGAHADIGGGVPPGNQGSAASHGDLSDVALNWMLWQARAATVPLAALATEQSVVSNPILHDARSSVMRTVQEGDRRVDNPDGRKQLDSQDEHHRLGREQRAATEALISRYENWRSNDLDTVGTVDLDAYARWLTDELGWHTVPI